MQAGNTSSSHTCVIGPRPKWSMSAYNASAPVTASTTAAREVTAEVPRDRGQHRDGGGDHAVAEEQRGAEHPEHHPHAPTPSASCPVPGVIALIACFPSPGTLTLAGGQLSAVV